MKQPYQLTDHPVGSLKEIWTLSWPLMISLMSHCLMLFVDRLYLAHYSLDAMNALAVAGMTSYLTIVLPVAVCEITEVFVGRFHGEGNEKNLTSPAWQMLWFCLFSWPLIALFGRAISFTLFANGSLEEQFLIGWADAVAPSMIGSVTLMGYFIAIGKTRVITACTIGGNLINILLAPLLIFGSSFNEAMGIRGTVFASAIAGGFQFLFLFLLFLKETRQWRFDKALFVEMCRVAIPASLGRVSEVLAHSAYFQIMAQAGKEALVIATVVQSFFLLVMFIIDAVAKSATAVISNLLGANEARLIPQVLRSSLKLHTLMFSGILLFCVAGIDYCLPFLLVTDDQSLLFSIKIATLLMSLFFLFDGFSWIFGGYLTAMKDTKFIFAAATAVSWICYVTPLYLLVTYAGAGGATGWAVITVSSLILCTTFFLRTRHLMHQETALA